MSEISLFEKQMASIDAHLNGRSYCVEFGRIFGEQRYKGAALLERDCYPFHFTASAWVTNRSKTRCLLIWHDKLDIWIQPGGHPEGNPRLVETALREATEETGLSSLCVNSEDILDLDVTPIPQRRNVPAHSHLDIRYWLWADESEFIAGSSEIRAARWLTLSEIRAEITDFGIIRMAESTLV